MQTTDTKRTIQDLPWTENGETVENIDLATAAELLEISERQLRRDRIAVENIVGKKLERRVSGRLYLHWENVLLIAEYRRIGVDAFADRHKPVKPEMDSDRYRTSTEAIEAEIVEAEEADIEVVEESGLSFAIVPVVASQIQVSTKRNALAEAIALMAVNADQERLNSTAERQAYLQQIAEEETELFLEEITVRQQARRDTKERLLAAKRAVQSVKEPKNNRRKAS